MAAEAVRTHQQSRVESSQTSLDAACIIFVSPIPVIGRDGRNGYRESYSFSEQHKAIYDAPRCEHWNR